MPEAIRREVKRLWLPKLLGVAWRRFGEDNSFALAGYLAYTGLLSFFPFMVFIVVVGSFSVGLETSLALVDALFELTPPEVAETLEPILVAIIETKTGFLAVLAAMVGLWAGSNAFEAARVGFNSAYDVREDRHFVSRRLQSLALAAAAALVFVSLSFLIVLWPTIDGLIAERFDASFDFEAFGYLRYAIGLPLLAVLLLALHLTLPKGRASGLSVVVSTEHGERWSISVVPGVFASVLLWFLAATAFSLYLRYAPSFAGNYGAMAGVVITLLFFYMSAVVIFFGAQINIAREELRRRRRVRGGDVDGARVDDDPSLARIRRDLALQG